MTEQNKSENVEGSEVVQLDHSADESKSGKGIGCAPSSILTITKDAKPYNYTIDGQTHEIFFDSQEENGSLSAVEKVAVLKHALVPFITNGAVDVPRASVLQVNGKSFELARRLFEVNPALPVSRLLKVLWECNRVVVLSFKKPAHEQHFGKMAELILKNEAPGILNWLLEGRAKLAKNKLQLTQNEEQRARAVNLLLGSDSPAAFVLCCIQRQKGSVIWLADLYEHYQKWCRKQSITPARSVDFMRMAKGTIETSFGLSPRHDLIGEEGTARRGWSGLAVVEGKAGEIIENQSSLSE